MLLLLCAVRVQAQVLAIHAPTDKATYADGEWLRRPKLSGQCHWGGPGVNDMPDPVLMPSHLHNDLGAPAYAELPAGVTIPVSWAVKQFDLKGKFGFIFGTIRNAYGVGHAAHDFTYDTPSPVTSFFPMMGTLKTWTGTFKIEADPGLNEWEWIGLGTEAHFDNGDTIDNSFEIPVWALTDPHAVTPVYNEQWIIEHCTPFPALATNTWGDLLTAIYGGYAPLAPLTETSWRGASVSEHGYGSSQFSLAHLDVVIDPDLHNMIPGTVLQTKQGDPVLFGHAEFPLTLDPHAIAASTPPAANAPNVHTLMIRGTFPNPETQQIGVSLVVVPVTLPDGTTPVDPPPPPVCVPPAVLTNGACVTPVIPPPPPPPPPPPVPTIVNVTTCMNVTFSDGSVTSDCMHRP